jgi:hypothetical protein
MSGCVWYYLCAFRWMFAIDFQFWFWFLGRVAGGVYLDSPKDGEDYHDHLEQTSLFLQIHGMGADFTVG